MAAIEAENKKLLTLIKNLKESKKIGSISDPTIDEFQNSRAEIYDDLQTKVNEGATKEELAQVIG